MALKPFVEEFRKNAQYLLDNTSLFWVFKRNRLKGIIEACEAILKEIGHIDKVQLDQVGQITIAPSGV